MSSGTWSNMTFIPRFFSWPSVRFVASSRRFGSKGLDFGEMCGDHEKSWEGFLELGGRHQNPTGEEDSCLEDASSEVVSSSSSSSLDPLLDSLESLLESLEESCEAVEKARCLLPTPGETGGGLLKLSKVS